MITIFKNRNGKYYTTRTIQDSNLTYTIAVAPAQYDVVDVLFADDRFVKQTVHNKPYIKVPGYIYTAENNVQVCCIASDLVKIVRAGNLSKIAPIMF